MVNTSSYPITIDGVRLDTYAWNVSTKVGRDASPGKKGANFDTGNVDGELWIPNKKANAGLFALKMWVGGTDEDGVVPSGDDYWKYTENLDSLKRMFNVSGRLIDVRQSLKNDGTKIRQALCEVTDIISPEMLAAYPYTTEFTVGLKIPGSFWQDVAESNFDSAIGLVANTNHTLPAPWPAATAPMRDLYVVLDGPATNPKLIDNRNGHYVMYNGILPNGQQWVVNTVTYSSKVGVGIAFTDTGTDVYEQTVYAGGHAPKMFGMEADSPGPQVRIEGSGFGANTRLRIRGKIKYL